MNKEQTGFLFLEIRLNSSEGHKKAAAIHRMTILYKYEISRLFETTAMIPVFGKWLSGVSRRCEECVEWGVGSVREFGEFGEC